MIYPDQIKKYFQQRRYFILNSLLDVKDKKTLENRLQDLLYKLQMDLCERGLCYEAFLLDYRIQENGKYFKIEFLMRIYHYRQCFVPFNVEYLKLLEVFIPSKMR